jgi:hypothetical protein
MAATDWVKNAPIVDADDGSTVGGLFAAQPSVWRNGFLYVAYAKGNKKDRFLIGFDDDTGGVNNGVVFRHLKDGSGQKVELTRRKAFNDFPPLLPGVGPANGFTTQIAVDPTNIRKVYIAYHDVATAVSSNANVYSRTITNAGGWFLGPETLVNADPGPPVGCSGDDHTDQFLPAITVDTEGRVHILHYDDRAFCQDDSVGSAAQYNVTYGVSCDGGQVYSNTALQPGLPGNAAFLDFFLEPLGFGAPREYIGITFVERLAGGIDVWSSFTGTDVLDPDPTNKSVIYSIPFQF